VELPSDVEVIVNMTRTWHNCGTANPQQQNKNARGRPAKPQPECRDIWEKIWRSIVFGDPLFM